MENIVRVTVEDRQKAVRKVEPAVVVLRTTAPRAFDTYSDSIIGSATGFVVDKRLGFILTNRHVVQPGPVVADAVFLKNEEVPIHLIYRDPTNKEHSSMKDIRVTVEDWQKTVRKVEPVIVVLRITAPRDFDTYSNSIIGSATGFVVDKRRGFILTNRQVVQPGPVVADAVVLNNEEVPIHPIYRDPVSNK